MPPQAEPKQASATLMAGIVNPIIEAAIETLDKMIDCPASRRDLCLKTAETTLFQVTAIIALNGKATGSICLSFSEQAAFGAVHRMLGMNMTEVDSLVCDAIAEFANVIAGCAKDKLGSLELSLGIPNVVRGQNMQIDFPPDSNPMCVTFDSDIGPFMLVFGFVSK